MREDTEDRFVTLPGGTRVCYRIDGESGGPPVLLIAGLAEDLTMWSGRFVSALLAAGFQVIRMDNRDCGRSTYAATPPPSTLRQLLARPRRDAYTLADMAADAAQLIEHLGLGPAHLVGRSMGGMIAQTVAARYPELTTSLTSLYSTTGDPKVGRPAASTMALLAAPPPRNREQAVRAHLRMTAHLAGAKFPIDEVEETRHAVQTWNRTAGDGAAGTARQIQAIHASGDRTTEIARITAPTLVINGDRDLAVAPSGGHATATTIPDARHVVIPGMGHHLPDALALLVADHVVGHLERTSA
ncbi:alpha/beta fold hydrolase [Amycolatopsis regifaucium]|uniref:Alpha/beta hydrolase n=1 Tax=Amycolatopsis regifaucium TaxID=546365 RepID=A0A154MFD9_9PSEU|nr:alpha/beta hydrolase [Amycolatopsis regifaucium]KZB82837.1 alpha/beta hydrolase [Amycolatopsis regifaucium]OKA03765.1 alpha/beta hydrolase [Amycolatopsis regifaucium]SFJ59833.1 Pimeloyl-ACP methyl ester carboxylesterase [Amycolatopsis regifaucium]